MNARKLSPFCHCFTVDDRHFAYDVHTNSLLEVEPALAAVLPLYGRLNRREITARLARTFGAVVVRDAFAAIERGRRERGLFLARRPRLVPPSAALSAPGACDRDLQHLVLTVTERCNLRCLYCVHGADLDWIRSHGVASMPLEIALSAVRYFLDRADPTADPVISFYGGEALLEPDLIESVVRAARAHPRGGRVTFAIDSNGVLLDDRAIDLAVREHMYLQISLDGPALQHDRHRVDRRGEPTHARIEAGLDRLLACDPAAAARLTFMITLAPPVDLPAVARYFAEFPPFRRHGIARTPRLRVSAADLRGLDWSATDDEKYALQQALETERARYLAALAAGHRDEAGPVAAALCEPTLIRWHHRNRAPLGPAWTPGGNCRPGRRKLHVMTDGSFHPCERTGSILPVGDVTAGIEASRVKLLYEQFHDVVKERCRDCWALRLCGLCFAAQASGQDGAGSNIPSSAWCTAQRRAQERNLRLTARALTLAPESRKWLDATRLS